MRRKTWALIGIVLLPLSPGAQPMPDAPKACGATDTSLPAALAGWTAASALTSANSESGLGNAALVPGRAARVSLHPTRQVAYVSQPEKPGGSVAHGGLLSLTVAEAGTYQINLDSGAWIDVLKDGAGVTSVDHGPGPACSGIHKTVAFPLAPGRYVIQISANADPTLQIMISRRP